jgi:hypothetical protein
MATKKEAKARKIAWQLALAEGRIVRSQDGMLLHMFATIVSAQAQASALRANGDYSAEIVKI